MKTFKFIDLFAGIGGFHLAMHSLGGECVFASEIDSFARKTYEKNLQKLSPDLFENKLFNDDIRSVSPSEIPDFDILCGGFPCQPFSQAGHKRGFDDNHKSERGNLFFNIVDILRVKRPKAFFLENVRGIVNHDNGNTFQVIREILEVELGYSFYFKVVKASDYGLPQLRPRAFMIGFRDDSVLKGFNFPKEKKLRFNMSDVFQGECTREIGFTIRVGGRGSPIDDRRNWDSYIVDGNVVRLMPEQAKKMQGFPDDFEFPVPNVQAMKQLGNSVAIDAIKECANSMILYMNSLNNTEDDMGKAKNKGEWTELFSFIKILHDKKIILADKNLNHTKNFFNVSKVSTLNIKNSCILTNDDTVIIESKDGSNSSTMKIKDIINDDILKTLSNKIKSGSGTTFSIEEFDVIQSKLGLSIIKGGHSTQKADIVLDIHNDAFQKNDENFGIKSYLGNKPTLLNASGNTNFIFKIDGLDAKHIDTVNSIETHTKLIDRLSKIRTLGGTFSYHKIEVDTMEYNLKLIDSHMPIILSNMLLNFFMNRKSAIRDNLKSIHESGALNDQINYGDYDALKVKIKKLLSSVLLGFFPGTKWDGINVANGTIVVKDDGQQVGFHIIDMPSLEEYLFENIKFDTPSTTRHRFGKVILERDGNLYFKLNLQLRF